MHCGSLCVSYTSLWPRERALTTTWITVNWWLFSCSGRWSSSGRRPSLSNTKLCWPNERQSWRGWSRRSKISRTTLTLCSCASWSRSPLSFKCAPSSSDEGCIVHYKTSTTAPLVFSLLCCPFDTNIRHRETDRMLSCSETRPRRAVWRSVQTVLNVAGPQVVFRFTPTVGFELTLSGLRPRCFHFSKMIVEILFFNSPATLITKLWERRVSVQSTCSRERSHLFALYGNTDNQELYFENGEYSNCPLLSSFTFEVMELPKCCWSLRMKDGNTFF